MGLLYLKAHRRHNLLEKLYPNSGLNKEQTKELVYYTIRLIQTKSNSSLLVESQLALAEIMGLLNTHTRFCNIDDCRCRGLRFSDDSIQMQPEDMQLKSPSKSSKLNRTVYLWTKHKELNKLVCEILGTTLKNLNYSKSDTNKIIMQAYINFFVLNQIYNALYNVILAESTDLSVFQEFQVFYIRKLVRLKMMEEEQRSSSLVKEDFGKVADFHKKYMVLHDLISDTILLYCKYWYQYLRNHPGTLCIHSIEISIIIKTGYDISKNCERIEEILHKLSLINMDNIKGRILYALFQKKVMEDDFGAFDSFNIVRQHREAQNIVRKHGNRLDMRQEVDSNAAVIIMSGNKQNIDTIIDTNQEVEQILGYCKSELVGENVALLMPAIIGIHHSFYTEKYFEKSNDANINRVIKKLAFAQNARGCIVPCEKLVRLVPNLERGIQFLGFISLAKDLSELRLNQDDIKTENLMLFLLNDHFDILGFCENVAEFCCGNNKQEANFKKYLQNDQKVNIKKLYPKIFSNENNANLRLAEGVTANIDLKILRRVIGAEIMDVYDNDSLTYGFMLKLAMIKQMTRKCRLLQLVVQMST